MAIAVIVLLLFKKGNENNAHFQNNLTHYSVFNNTKAQIGLLFFRPYVFVFWKDWTLEKKREFKISCLSIIDTFVTCRFCRFQKRVDRLFCLAWRWKALVVVALVWNAFRFVTISDFHYTFVIAKRILGNVISIFIKKYKFSLFCISIKRRYFQCCYIATLMLFSITEWEEQNTCEVRGRGNLCVVFIGFTVAQWPGNDSPTIDWLVALTEHKNSFRSLITFWNELFYHISLLNSLTQGCICSPFLEQFHSFSSQKSSDIIGTRALHVFLFLLLL